MKDNSHVAVTLEHTLNHHFHSPAELFCISVKAKGPNYHKEQWQRLMCTLLWRSGRWKTPAYICCVFISSPAKWRHVQRRLVGVSSWMSGRAQRRWKLRRNHKVSLQKGCLEKLGILMLIKAVWIIHNGSLIKRMLLLLSVCKLSISRWWFLRIVFIIQTYLLNDFRGAFAPCLVQEELAGHIEWSEFTMITSVFIGYIDHLEGFCCWLDVLTFGRRTPARTLAHCITAPCAPPSVCHIHPLSLCSGLAFA